MTSPNDAPVPLALPDGYRGGIITAITVFIGFSLSFVHYWVFDAPGEWSARSIAALIGLVLPILAEIYTLYRALLVRDHDEPTYAVTIKWFIWSVCAMLLAVCFAGLVHSVSADSKAAPAVICPK